MQGSKISEQMASASDLAVLFDISARRINQHWQDGTLPPAENGKANLVASVRAYIEYVSHKKSAQGDDEDEARRRKAEADLKESKAKLAEIELRELQGEMHRASDVELLTGDVLQSVRQALMALPGRIAVDVCNVSTQAEASEIIKKDIHAIMRELSEYEYDPSRYEELVRQRKEWREAEEDDEVK